MRAIGHREALMYMHRLLIPGLLLAGSTLWASDFLMEGVDAGRTGWVKDEKVFTTANVGSMKLLWKIKLNSTPREMHNLFAPLIAERVTTARGVREMAVVAGVSDDLFGIDASSGELMWTTHFDSTYTPPPGARTGDTLCPGGQTAVPAIGAASTPGAYTVYAVSWDGRLRQINLADGKEVAPPEKFMPANGKPYALNLVKGVIYTASAQGCGGVTNAFYSFDLATRKSSIFLPAGGGLWGRRGAAVSDEGTAFLGTGDAQFNPATRSLGNGIVGVKLDANQQLQLVDYFGAPNANWLWRRDLDVNVTPMSFEYSRPQVPRRDEQGMPPVAARSRGARRRRSSDDALHDTAAVQRRAGVRQPRRVGRDGDLAGCRRCAVGARAFLGAGQQDFPGPGRAFPSHRRRRGGLPTGREGGQMAADAGVAVARHGSR
jgi:hypothetical protein